MSLALRLSKVNEINHWFLQILSPKFLLRSSHSNGTSQESLWQSHTHPWSLPLLGSKPLTRDPTWLHTHPTHAESHQFCHQFHPGFSTADSQMSHSREQFTDSTGTQKQLHLGAPRTLNTKSLGFYPLTVQACGSLTLPPEPAVTLSVCSPCQSHWSLHPLLCKGSAIHGLLPWAPTMQSSFFSSHGSSYSSTLAVLFPSD